MSLEQKTISLFESDQGLGARFEYMKLTPPSMFVRYKARMPGSVLSVLYLCIISTFIACCILIFHRPSDVQCAKQLSSYSPALEAVEYVNIDFDADFDAHGIYRGPPTPEREQAWFNLTTRPGIEVPRDRIHLLNRTEADNLQHVPAEVGTGYTAILEVYHQLHCLNMIRGYTWWQVGKYPGTPDGLSEDRLMNRMHVDHCIESLRMSLQCFGDVTPLLIREVPHSFIGGKADFNTHHRCRNFDRIQEWVDVNYAVL
ncbi:hypothetical protein EJ05DRAFT_480943 [Pseudovirgaria hyperparasitica]|uniref:Tat pathway signal sequence n=1 Tax=Pseudovirgaria hyperparasitica TaxID=470096 RepID=A0A6A6VQA1_9PEZI|nr:uncharacterized protein EJ05DRAFT_480943 [Pseudovirgaria hyperparasitica]KAF2752792.1 hypothetical protein EJ05DRAFT_480943 [Pseudovirgaria hyperparasitica]